MGQVMQRISIFVLPIVGFGVGYVAGGGMERGRHRPASAVEYRHPPTRPGGQACTEIVIDGGRAIRIDPITRWPIASWQEPERPGERPAAAP